MQKKLLILITIIMLVSVSLFSGTTGKLAGRVKDQDGKPVAYANVLLKGTSIGVQTDESGKFMLINISPGTYTIVCQLMGFYPSEITGVRINVDETRTQNITLTRTTYKMPEREVKAKEELVSKGRAGSEKSVNADQMSDMAVTSVDDVIAQSAGVTQKNGELFVRGGRANEVKFTIDGMNVSDPVDGGNALQMDMDAVADMKVSTGGFTAEYGNAQSGIVNIVSKDGSERYEGKLESTTDHLFTDGSNMDEIKFALGGPVIPFISQEFSQKFTFFMNGAGAWTDSRFRDYYVSDPNKELKYISSATYDPYDPYESRDETLGFEIGDRNYNDYNINLKTKYTVSPTLNFTLALRGDRSVSTPFAYSWRYALQHYAESETNQKQIMGTIDYTINVKTNLKIKASYYEKTQYQNPRGITKDNYITLSSNPADYAPEYGLYGYNTLDENLDGIYDQGFNESSLWQYSIDGLTDPLGIPNFNAPGTIWDNFIDDTTKSINFRADYEYQMSDVIGFKTGFEAIKYSIEKNQLAGFLTNYRSRFDSYLDNGRLNGTITPADSVYNEDNDMYTYYYSPQDYTNAALASSGTRDGYKAEPWQFAYYLQDKMEWEGMIVNAGVRLDFWYLGSEYSILTDNNTYRIRKFDKDDRLQMMVSPRLGISHPISERDVVHFAYNYQNQLPPMRYIFTSKDTIDAYTSNGVTVGNPKLEPQITITYEVGLQHQLSEDYVATVTAYYKNFYNYVSTYKELSTTEASVFWYNYISQDYGSARGLDMNLSRRMFNFISADASYSLAWAQGNNSSTVVQDENTSLREFPLDWDIRHNFNFNLTFKIDKDEEFMVPYTSWILPFDDFTASLSYNIASGQPYTAVNENNTALDTNDKRQEYTSTADLKLTKRIFVSKNAFFRLNFTIENLFKKRNINTVYAKTGSPYYDGAEIDTDGYVFEETQYLHDLFTNNPSNTNNNRNYIFGISFNF